MNYHKIASFFIIVVQLPFIVANIGLSMFYPHSQCMDQPLSINFLVLRPWFMIAAISSLALMAAMVIINSLNRKGYLSLLKMLDYG